MGGPCDRATLHQLGQADRRPTESTSPFESTLDSLLSRAEQCTGPGGQKTEPQAEVSPLEQLRATFVDRLIPLVDTIQARYAQKGITVSMDASDFLSGGRGVQIEIHYRDHRLRLEGTVMPDAIAFHETRHVSGSGGAVMGGPMLRARHLTDQAFTDFIYQRIIQIVKSTGRSS